MFKNKLKIEAVRGEDFYILTSRFSYITNLGDIIIVPKGFKTNFASIPPVLGFYCSSDHWTIRPGSVIHDYLYSAESAHLGFTRKQADSVLLESMLGLGMRTTQAFVIYYVLRLCGRSHYEKR
jgi:hypothetical protein